MSMLLASKRERECRLRESQALARVSDGGLP
jgi:hypothetical protein